QFTLARASGEKRRMRNTLDEFHLFPLASCLKAERRLFLGRQFFCCTRRRNMTAQSDRRKIGMKLLAGKRFFFTIAGPMRIQCGPNADMNGRRPRHNERRGSRAGAFLALSQKGSAADGYHLEVLGFDERRPIGGLIMIRPQTLKVVAQPGLAVFIQRRERALRWAVPLAPELDHFGHSQRELERNEPPCQS